MRSSLISFSILFILMSQILIVPAFTQEAKSTNVQTAEKVEVIGVKENQEDRTGATKTDPTGFVTVIKAEKFKGRYSSLADVLEREAGVRVRRFGGLGSYTTLSIRGSNPNQVRIFLDGVPLNNSQGGEINLSDLPFDNLDRIEIYKSGSAPGFSGSAIGGAVNLVTSRKDPIKQTRITSSAGSLNTGRISASHSNFTEKVRYSLFVQNEKSDQNFVFRNNNGTPVLNRWDDFDDRRRNAQFNRYNLTGNVSADINKTTFKFLNDFNYRMQGIPGPGNNQTKKVTREYIRNTTSLGTETPEIYSENIKLESRLYYTGARDHLFDPLSEFSSGTPNSKADIQQYGLHLIPTFYFLKYNQIFRLLVSSERETFRRDRRNSFDDVQDKSTRKFRNHNAIQIQDEIRLLEKRITLTPAVNFEQYTDRFNDTTNSGIISASQAISTGTNPAKTITRYTNYRIGFLGIPYRTENLTFGVKANAATEKRIPDFLELFGERGSILGNPGLKPERSINYDGGPVLDYSGDRLTSKTSISYFSKKIQDMILFVPNSQFSLRPENIDSAMIRGFEFSQKFDLFRMVKLESNYTYQRAINTSDVSFLKGKYLPLRPKNEWMGGVSYYNKFVETGFEAVFIGAVFKDRTNEYANYQPSRWIYNVYFTYYFGGKDPDKKSRELMLTFEVKNISNIRAEDIVGYPLPGRIWYATVSGKF